MTTHKLENEHPTAKQPALAFTGKGASLSIQKNQSWARGHPDALPRLAGPTGNASGFEQTIKEFVPPSWFHPVGIYKVLARVWNRLPDVGGKLFLTFTLDPKLYANEEAAFEDSRNRLRKVFFQLRHGVEHECKVYTIDAPYCVKVEFHDPKDGQVKLDGEHVVTFPKLTEFQQVTLKVLRWEERDKRLSVKDAEIVA